MPAGAQLKAAVRGEPRRRLLVARYHGDAPADVHRGAVRCLLAIDCDTDPDQAAIRLAAALPRADRRNIDRFDGPAQRFGVIAAIEMLVGDVVERHLIGRDEISDAYEVWLDPRLARDRVEHELEREADTGARDTAIRQDRAFVGCS